MVDSTPRWGSTCSEERVASARSEEPLEGDSVLMETCRASDCSSCGSTSEAPVRGVACSTDQSDTDKEERNVDRTVSEAGIGSTDSVEKEVTVDADEISFAVARAKFLGSLKSRSSTDCRPCPQAAATAQPADRAAGGQLAAAAQVPVSAQPAASAQGCGGDASTAAVAAGSPPRLRSSESSGALASANVPAVTSELEVKLRRQMLKCEGADPVHVQRCITPQRRSYRRSNTANAALTSSAVSPQRPAAHESKSPQPAAQRLRPVRLSQFPERMPEAAKPWPRNSRTNSEADAHVGNLEVRDDTGQLGGGSHVLSSATLSKMVRPLCLEVLQEMRFSERLADVEEMRLCDRMAAMEATIRELQASSASPASPGVEQLWARRAESKAATDTIAELQASVARLEESLLMKVDQTAVDELVASVQRFGAERQAAESKYLTYINRVSEGIQKVMPSVSKQEKVVQECHETVQRLKELCTRTARATTSCQEVLLVKADQQKLQRVEQKLDSMVEGLHRNMEAGLEKAAQAALDAALPRNVQSLREAIEANQAEIVSAEDRILTKVNRESLQETSEALARKAEEHESQVKDLTMLQLRLQETLGRKAESSELADAQGRLCGLQAAMEKFSAELSRKATKQEMSEEVDRFHRAMTQAKWRRS